MICPRCSRETEPKPLFSTMTGALGEPRWCVLPTTAINRCETDLVAAGVMERPERKPRPVLEKDIQRRILKYLGSQDGVFAWRASVGKAEYDGRTVMHGLPGQADILACVYGRFVAVEVKRPGGKQSPAQERFEANVNKALGFYVLATDVGHVKDVVEQIKREHRENKYP